MLPSVKPHPLRHAAAGLPVQCAGGGLCTTDGEGILQGPASPCEAAEHGCGVPCIGCSSPHARREPVQQAGNYAVDGARVSFPTSFVWGSCLRATVFLLFLFLLLTHSLTLPHSPTHPPITHSPTHPSPTTYTWGNNTQLVFRKLVSKLSQYRHSQPASQSASQSVSQSICRKCSDYLTP